jgi:hypothetical protein
MWLSRPDYLNLGCKKMDNLPVRSASVLMMSGGLQNLAGAAAIAAIE